MFRTSALATAAILLLLPSCRNESLSHGEYLYDFKSLPQMVATSDAVIEGTVVEIADGKTLVVDSDDVIQYMNVTVSVDQVFSGTLDGSDAKVTIVEYPTVELPLSTEGHGFFFLYWDESDGVYTLIGPEGRLMADGQGGIDSTAPKEDWITVLEGLTVAQFRSLLEDAVSQAAQGSVEPATPIVGIS